MLAKLPDKPGKIYFLRLESNRSPPNDDSTKGQVSNTLLYNPTNTDDNNWTTLRKYSR